MVIHIYAKLSESLSIFEDVIDIIKTDNDDIIITNESRRSFRELDNIKHQSNNVFVISSLTSLGLSDADIANQLSWFTKNVVTLVICDIPSTYEFGISQPMNQAILSTILQSVLTNNKKVITVSFKRANSGRSKVPFPENWDELYEQWANGDITSKSFIEQTGLKKATFYNLMTEYKRILSENAKFIGRYKIV